MCKNKIEIPSLTRMQKDADIMEQTDLCKLLNKLDYKERKYIITLQDYALIGALYCKQQYGEK